MWGLFTAFRASGAFKPAMALLAGAVVALGIWMASASNTNSKRDLRDLKETEQTGDRIDETISDGVGVPWRERLLGK